MDISENLVYKWIWPTFGFTSYNLILEKSHKIAKSTKRQFKSNFQSDKDKIPSKLMLLPFIIENTMKYVF